MLKMCIICMWSLSMWLISCRIIIKSDLIGETTSSGQNITLIGQPYLNFPQPGALNIWGPTGRNVVQYSSLTISQNFTLACNKPISIYVSADDSFVAYINDIEVLRSSYIQLLNTTRVPSQLNIFPNETSTLRIFTQDVFGSIACVTYQIVQDQCQDNTHSQVMRASTRISEDLVMLATDPTSVNCIAYLQSADHFYLWNHIQNVSQTITMVGYDHIRTPNQYRDELNRYEYEELNKMQLVYEQVDNTLHATYNNLTQIVELTINMSSVSTPYILQTSNVFDQCQYTNRGIFDRSGPYIAYLSCGCGQLNCSVMVSNALTVDNNTSSISYTVSSAALNSESVVSMKLSQNGDTLAILTALPYTLLVFRLTSYDSTATLLASRTMTYQESLAYFVLVSYDRTGVNGTLDWLTGVVYAVQTDNQLVLNIIDHTGADTLLNNNIQAGIGTTRIYASKNGRYIGLLTKVDQFITKFEMYQFSKFNSVGMRFTESPEFTFEELGQISSLQISHTGDRITYIVLRDGYNQIVTLRHILGHVGHIRPCNNAEYVEMFPQYCTSSASIAVQQTSAVDAQPVQNMLQTQPENSTFKSQYLVLPSFIMSLTELLIVIVLGIVCLVQYRKWKNNKLKQHTHNRQTQINNNNNKDRQMSKYQEEVTLQNLSMVPQAKFETTTTKNIQRQDKAEPIRFDINENQTECEVDH